MLVTELIELYSSGGLYGYYICPRCGTTMERIFMAYCDRCGQCLSWRDYQQATVLNPHHSDTLTT